MSLTTNLMRSDKLDKILNLFVISNLEFGNAKVIGHKGLTEWVSE